jgi:hypothetical protein
VGVVGGWGGQQQLQLLALGVRAVGRAGLQRHPLQRQQQQQQQRTALA